MYSLVFAVFGASVLTVSIAQNVVSLAPQPLPTMGSSNVVSPSFAGFGIEPSNLYSFTGGSQPNELTINLLSNLANYTGTPPHLRIGGNTEDNMIWQASQNDYVVQTNPNPVGQGAFPTDQYIIGPRYLEVLNRFPSNTPITYGLNMAYEESDYLTLLTTWANAVRTGISNLNLVSFEVGNEPDLYGKNAFRNGTWNGQIYTQQWLTRVGAIWEQVLQPNGIASDFFEPGCTASTIGTTFEIEMTIQDGITIEANGSSQPYVSSFNQHDYYYYIGVSGYALTIDHFADLSTTNAQFQFWDGQIMQALNAGYPFALREMGVVGPIGMDGITNVFAASLWTFNFFFYAASLNISSVQMHMTDNSNASAWQPIRYYGNHPFVRPNYYAWAAFDQTIGRGCQARISGYVINNPPAGYADHIGAYAVYQANTLASIVIINTVLVNASTTTKNSLTVDLQLPTQFAGQKLYLAYLTAAGADSRYNTTWNGISYEQSGNGLPSIVNTTARTVTIGSDGSVSVTVRDSQAVVANIGSPVGSSELNPSACAALASQIPDARPVATPVGTTTASAIAGGATSTSTSAASSTGSLRPTSTSGVTRFICTFSGIVATSVLSGFVLLYV